MSNVLSPQLDLFFKVVSTIKTVKLNRFLHMPVNININVKVLCQMVSFYVGYFFSAKNPPTKNGHFKNENDYSKKTFFLTTTPIDKTHVHDFKNYWL